MVIVSSEYYSWWPASMLIWSFFIKSLYLSEVNLWASWRLWHEDTDPLIEFTYGVFGHQELSQIRISWLYFFWCIDGTCNPRSTWEQNWTRPNHLQGRQVLSSLNSMQSHSRNKHTFISGVERYIFLDQLFTDGIDALRVMVHEGILSPVSSLLHEPQIHFL